MNKFTDYGLEETIIDAVKDLGYEQPTAIQELVLPQVLAGQDVLAKSQTGSGKTAAYAIPISNNIDWTENKPQALILTPTRELAVQVMEDFTNIGRYKRIKAVAIYGKQPIKFQIAALRQKTHIVAGTPGRVMDHIERETINFDKIQYLVIDEADEMLNMGFIEQVEKIIKKLPTDRKTLLFSATFPEAIKRLAKKYMIEPVLLEAAGNQSKVSTIRHEVIEVPEEMKYDTFRKVTTAENPDSCIVFCRTKDQVAKVCDNLTEDGYSVDMLHGGMTQDDRLAVMNDFRKGDFRYLVATDVAARGIDIDHITMVVQYDLPLEKESYVHRAGRTGRAGKEGKVITFVTPYEGKFLHSIEEFIGFKINRVNLPTSEQVALNIEAFKKKMATLPERKIAKKDQLNDHITKLYFNGGKKKKIRAIDFVGTLTNIDGIDGQDIGIITIQDSCTFIEILNDKGHIVLKAMQNKTVKNKQLKVHIAKK
ncbi:DEAD/DEAH box helicase [Kurthia sibirica]|uniref:ATP-dependent RNA helicase DbpA n=1 Tax=Kurthia sibirica TaxID=202750 RepID=A0A2U3AME2_9BACL|nr:DEAD/DEAH box helicase [Kurthia sibirica]PWI25694.1 RNA helicase [Kurthia sibirica]GEK33699.1 ATP-dependent RNA helicase DbpA [Kurthia sibirica]